MVEQETNNPESQAEHSEKNEAEKRIEPLKHDVAAINEFLDIILQKRPTENTEDAKARAEIQLDLADFLLRKRIGDLVEIERLSDLSNLSEKKRPADMSTEDIPKLQIPPGEIPEKIVREVLGRWECQTFNEEEVATYTLYTLSAQSALNSIKGKVDHILSAEECDIVAQILKEAYIDLLAARRLVVLHGYDLPTFTNKQLDEKDPNKLVTQVDKNINRALNLTESAFNWCEANINQHRDIDSFAYYLDIALGAIANADAGLKGMELAKGEG